MISITTRHEPLLGTLVELRVTAKDDQVAQRGSATIVTEMQRLEQIFSVHRDDSEISRWRVGEIDDISSELNEVLALAHRWHAESHGAFNPASGVLTAVWQHAVTTRIHPTESDLATAAAAIADLPYRVVDGRVERTGDCSSIDLNAIAKGWIADRAAAHAFGTLPLTALTVNAGGDLLQRGDTSMLVGVENPHRPYDNEKPLDKVRIRDAGLATSGSARRPITVGATKHSHVVDPRTGAPVDTIASISVVAGDAVEADVLATVLGVTAGTDLAAALELAEAHAAACLIVTSDRLVYTNERWRDLRPG